MNQAVKTNVNLASREFFQVSLVTYLILTLAETFKEGFVSNFFNMNYLLLVVLVTGVAMVLTEPPESELGQAVGAVQDKVQEAAGIVHRRVVRPAVDTMRRTAARPQVLDLRSSKPSDHTKPRP